MKNKFTKIQLEQHISALKEKVFFNKTKWPHFDLLFEDILKLSKVKNKKILFLERGGLYGNISLFCPLFFKNKTTSFDCSSKFIRSRGSYNKKFVIDKKIIKWPVDKKILHQDLKLKKNFYDLIIVPNLIHHIDEHEKFLKNCNKSLKKKGLLYIFEPLVREIHQKPDDYVRFTSFGLENLLNKCNFTVKVKKDIGGPFTVVAYCIDQALQYIPKEKNFFLNSFYKENFKKLKELDNKYKKNIFRKNTSFPMAYSIIATK